MEDGKVDPDVWAIGDAAIIKTAVLPATAQGGVISFTIPSPLVSSRPASQVEMSSPYLSPSPLVLFCVI